MTSLRGLALQGLDTLSGAFQAVFQSYGFLSDNREAVVERASGDGRFALLPDKPDEGWPAFEFPLPSDAKFQQAASGILSGTAIWSTPQEPAGVSTLMQTHFANRAPAVTQDGSVSTIALADLSVRIRIGVGAGRTLLAVQQRREPDAVGDALRAKLNRR